MNGVSKLAWALLRPTTLLLLALALGALLLWRRNPRGQRVGRILVTVLLAAIAAIGLLPVGRYVVTPLENRFQAPETLPARIDGIVVLGGAMDPSIIATRGTAALDDHAPRLAAAFKLAERHPEARILLTGRSGTLIDHGYSEARFGRSVLEKLGLPPARILSEERSRNTYENALYGKDLAKPVPYETWLLVTSARHMPRAMGVFRKLGWTVIPYPVDYDTDGSYWFGLDLELAFNLQLLNDGAKEWGGLVVYYLRGWTDSLFPKP